MLSLCAESETYMCTCIARNTQISKFTRIRTSDISDTCDNTNHMVILARLNILLESGHSDWKRASRRWLLDTQQ